MEQNKLWTTLAGTTLCLTAVGVAYWHHHNTTSGGRRSNKKKEGKVVGRVQSIHVYPVKSCRGIQLDSSAVEPRGLLLDRLWMVVTSAGTFRTQRQLPKMSQIQPNLPSSLTAVRRSIYMMLYMCHVRPRHYRYIFLSSFNTGFGVECA